MRSQFCRKCNAWRGNLGLEPSIELYVEHLVEIFREVRRVLRKDGTVWLNLGDSYAGSNCGSNDYRPDGASLSKSDAKYKGQRPGLSGLKPKDLCMIPARVALALQADGWYLRSDIIWAKRNCMPESVTDRPTKSHEHVFLLTKSKRYYYDADAIREAKAPSTIQDTRGNSDGKRRNRGYPGNASVGGTNLGGPTNGRNKRDVWFLSTMPYSGAHFATFPPALVDICVKAGTSEKGACPICGAPWERIVKREGQQLGRERNRGGRTDGYTLPAQWENGQNPTTTTTIGWRPTCNHYPRTDEWQSIPRQDEDESDEAYQERIAPIIALRHELLVLWQPMETCSCLITDPFSGAATTGLVASRLGRDYVGIEMNMDYCKMGHQRIIDDAPLFNS